MVLMSDNLVTFLIDKINLFVSNKWYAEQNIIFSSALNLGMTRLRKNFSWKFIPDCSSNML